MPQYSIQFDMSFKDLWTLLFRKKICPRCGAKLIRHMAKQTTGPKCETDGDGQGLEVWHGSSVREKTSYRFEACRLTLTLTQLRLGLPGMPTSETTDANLLEPGAQ